MCEWSLCWSESRKVDSDCGMREKWLYALCCGKLLTVMNNLYRLNFESVNLSQSYGSLKSQLHFNVSISTSILLPHSPNNIFIVFAAKWESKFTLHRRLGVWYEVCGVMYKHASLNSSHNLRTRSYNINFFFYLSASLLMRYKHSFN